MKKLANKSIVKSKAVKVLKSELGYLERLTQNGRFIQRHDGWITDTLLGLDWGPTSEKYMDYAGAGKHCADNGGRLPTLRELHSLVDYENYDPAINTNFFKDTKSNYYWTSTQNKKYPSYAWCVVFYGGFVSYYFKDNGYYVRPVRASQFLAL